VSLRLRLAATFALVALVTGLAVAIAAPSIVGRGFARMQQDVTPGGGPGMGGGGNGPGPMAGAHAAQIEQETTETIVIVALVSAAAASVIGYFIAGRIAAPLRRLEDAASAVAAGDLSRRSGIGGRGDEIGNLGLSFDAMAAELETAEASRRRFFQDAAHELKTPLAVIEATANAVLDGVYDHDAKHLETIRAQSRILARIVDDLRTISLAETRGLPLALEEVPVGEAVGAARDAFDARARESGVELASEVDASLRVVADRDRLGQMLGALLDNAIRHTPPGGIVRVAAAAPASRTVRISVADTGPGLEPEDVRHVFDRFYQADRARDRGTGTSGLGLSIVRALAAAQEGTAGVESAPGRGATFWIELRRA
jgi:signal transduction histidine kinase